MKVAVSGSRGFLGWHTRAALHEAGAEAVDIRVGGAYDPSAATSAASCDRLIHIAGVNRGSDSEVNAGNVTFAGQVADAVRAAERPPRVIAFANSTQATNGSVYGDSKAQAAEILSNAAADVGAEFADIQLPNLFGEHGRPFYNAVTSTFCELLARGESPTVENDKLLTLLHAQDAADVMAGNATPDILAEATTQLTVSELLDRLRKIADTYAKGDIPDVSTKFERDLFNTYRSYTLTSRTAIPLARRADARGAFFEIVRSHGGTGQSSFSTTVPGVTRGDHYHRRKVERFTVLAGQAVIRLRKLFSTEVVEVHANGDSPVAVDMPTMWSHSITNTGPDLLYTSFWTNDIFDPSSPDTIPEAVIQ